MRNTKPVPDRRDGGDHPEQKPLGQLLDSEHELWSRPSLTIAESARTCGVSASTIRRYLAAGRFPAAYQQPNSTAGQRGLWRIPTQDLAAADLRPGQGRRPDQEQKNEPSSGQPGDDRVRELEHALELERTRRRAAEDLAAERAHTIQTLESALAALQAQHAAPAPNPTAPLPSQRHHPAPRTQPEPVPQPGMLPMVPKRRLAKGELSQEEKAAIIGRALSGQRPPKRRWL